MIKKSLFLLTLLVLNSCSTKPPIMETQSVNFTPKNVSKMFQASYDYVWQCALKEMQSFPLKIVNKEGGSIITDYVTTRSDRYETSDAIMHMEPRNEIKYYIDVRILPFDPSEGVPQTQVSITKYTLKIGSFGSPRPIASDLIDEQVILHRIKRLLELERLKIERNGK